MRRAFARALLACLLLAPTQLLLGRLGPEIFQHCSFFGPVLNILDGSVFRSLCFMSRKNQFRNKNLKNVSAAAAFP